MVDQMILHFVYPSGQIPHTPPPSPDWALRRQSLIGSWADQTPPQLAKTSLLCGGQLAKDIDVSYCQQICTNKHQKIKLLFDE
jgi:hypothetical protein